jgi:protein phosphatase PTC2/3
VNLSKDHKPGEVQ